MSISGRVYLARAAGKLFSISYILDIMSASAYFNVCFCIAAIRFLHVLETKKPRESFILGASCQTTCRPILQHETPIGCPRWTTLKCFSNRVITRHLFLKTVSLFIQHSSWTLIFCQLFFGASGGT